MQITIEEFDAMALRILTLHHSIESRILPNYTPLARTRFDEKTMDLLKEFSELGATLNWRMRAFDHRLNDKRRGTFKNHPLDAHSAASDDKHQHN